MVHMRDPEPFLMRSEFQPGRYLFYLHQPPVHDSIRSSSSPHPYPAHGQSTLPSAHRHHPEQELAALVSQVAALSILAVDVTRHCLDSNDKGLSRLAFDMTRHCIDINDKLPCIVRAQVEAAVSEIRPTPAFYQGIALTPDQLEAQFPPGRGDNQAWHVVCIGRQSGLYASADESNEQILGVPNQSRRKMQGRGPALAYYHQMYDLERVMRLAEIPT